MASNKALHDMNDRENSYCHSHLMMIHNTYRSMTSNYLRCKTADLIPRFGLVKSQLYRTYPSISDRDNISQSHQSKRNTVCLLFLMRYCDRHSGCYLCRSLNRGHMSNESGTHSSQDNSNSRDRHHLSSSRSDHRSNDDHNSRNRH